MGGEVVLKMDDLLKHTLVVGGKGMGKTSFLMNLFNHHRDMCFPSVVFDSKGKLWDHAVNVSAETDDPNVILVNSGSLQWMSVFDPLKGAKNPRTQLTSRLCKVIYESCQRSGIPLALPFPKWQDPNAVRVFLKSLFPDGSYFQGSVLIRKNALNMPSALKKCMSLLVQIPDAAGSKAYGMLFFDQFLEAALASAPEVPYLVLVDHVWDFVSDRLNADVLKQLTERRIGMVLSTTYDELGKICRSSKGLYRTLLNNSGTVAAFVPDPGDPDYVIEAVADRLS